LDELRGDNGENKRRIFEELSLAVLRGLGMALGGANWWNGKYDFFHL
jgi:hypothetical protein